MEKGYHNIQPTNYTEHTILKDQNIYGAARIGSKIINKEIYSRDFNISGGDFVTGQTTVSEHTHFENIDKTKRIVGYKHYEMANLPITIGMGNVLNVVTDRKVGNVGGTGYEADIVSYSDYYPYGMLLPERVGSEDDSTKGNKIPKTVIDQNGQEKAVTCSHKYQIIEESVRGERTRPAGFNTQTASTEELRTVGLSEQKEGDITEQQIMSEHHLNIRGKY